MSDKIATSESDFRVTGVVIRTLIINGEKVKAVCSITINNAFAVHDVKVIMNKLGELVVAMPNRRVDQVDGRSTYRDIAHPINNEARKIIENAVLAEYKRQYEKETKRR